jgi:5-methylcytosine-specific restriction endonuclease McrA
MACGLVGGKYDVDHIVPYRLMVQWNLEANALVNLLTTCDTCHARKTNTEVRLLKGDVVGFKRELFRVNYPEDRVRAAFAFAGIKW